jgi:uracil-DNA glycosylase
MGKHLFDTGYDHQPFRSLCEEYPGEDIYSPRHFRTEWGPIFHRGRLDGSARVLVIGQDPSQHENVARRILVGEAGHRTQGFLAKLGIQKSYVMINTFLYSLYGKAPSSAVNDQQIAGYRNRWLDALLVGKGVEAVMALGSLAEEAWKHWKATPAGQQVNVPFVRITHPTQPESSSMGNMAKLRNATRRMLADWNAALQTLHPAIQHPDVQRQLVLYGTAFAEGEKLPIPELDLPAGIPVWMGKDDGWARRAGKDQKSKRMNITLTVPKEARPR